LLSGSPGTPGSPGFGGQGGMLYHLKILPFFKDNFPEFKQNTEHSRKLTLRSMITGSAGSGGAGGGGGSGSGGYPQGPGI